MKTKIHTFTASQEGLGVNAFIIETDEGLALIDSLLLNSDSKALRQKLDGLGKPLLAVFITHGHPDHIAGLANIIRDENTPVVATQGIYDAMKTTKPQKYAAWAEMYGSEWIDKERWIYPNQIVSNGENLTFGGLQFTSYDMGPGGDSDANCVWILEGDQPAAFVGDLVFNRYFAYMNDGKILRWLSNLDRLNHLVNGATLYVGHGEKGDKELIQGQKDYLTTYGQLILETSNGKSFLSDEQIEEFASKFEQTYSGYGNNVLVGLSAQTVAHEIG